MHDGGDDGSINGNRYIPFTDLIRLEKAADGTFRSRAKAFAPGGGTSAYGGHVFAQAVWAAAQTVREGFVVHVRGCTFSFGKACFLLSSLRSLKSVSFLRSFFLFRTHRPPGLFVCVHGWGGGACCCCAALLVPLSLYLESLSRALFLCFPWSFMLIVSVPCQTPGVLMLAECYRILYSAGKHGVSVHLHGEGGQRWRALLHAER